MSKKREDLGRFKALIENDRLSGGEKFSDLLVADLKRVLSDYFELSDSPKVIIEKNGRTLCVAITFSSQGVKPFVSIP